MAGPRPGEVRKIVLAYSGGLDTSVILRWLQQTYDCEVDLYCGSWAGGRGGAARVKRLEAAVREGNLY